jgi:hypothetical protein
MSVTGRYHHYSVIQRRLFHFTQRLLKRVNVPDGSVGGAFGVNCQIKN